MASVIVTKIGTPIRLNLQLSDGEEALPLVVKAKLKDESGVDIFTEQTLSHVGGGLFKNSSLVMPEERPEITAQYTVYEANGTTKAPYDIDYDIFRPLESVSGEINVESLISQLSTESIDVDIDEEEVIEVDIEEAQP